MHRIYRINSGIEFRLGVKEKILFAMAIIFTVAVILNLEKLLEIAIAGF